MGYKPDKKDIEILRILAYNARESFVNISNKTKLTPETIRYRLKNLLKSEIISGFYARTNKHRFGLNMYIILLKVNDWLKKKDILRIYKLENVHYVAESLWLWNLVIGFSAKDTKELVNVLNEIRRYFNARLVNLDLHILLERYKFIMMPDGIK